MIESLYDLYDLEGFENIPELHIKDCPSLRLHGLGNHENFTIESENYSDIDLSMFRNAQFLKIPGYFEYVKGFDNVLLPFSNLTFLTIRYNDKYFNLSYFPRLQSLHLIKAKLSSELIVPSTLQRGEFDYCSFDDLSVLSMVKELSFLGCSGRQFNNINCLSNVYKLSFSYIEELENVSCLDRVHDLRIHFCKKVKDISKLGRVHRLCVDTCMGELLGYLLEGQIISRGYGSISCNNYCFFACIRIKTLLP